MGQGKIIGLDISTTTIGISCLDFNSHDKLNYLSYYKPIKNTLPLDPNEDFLQTLHSTKSEIISTIKSLNPDYIAVEDYIRFLKGGSGSATIIPLAILNRTLCLAIKEEFPQVPLKICNVISIRTLIKKELNLSQLPAKEELPQHLSQLLQIQVPILTKSIKKKSKIIPETYDQSDAIAVAYFAYKKFFQ